MNGWRMRLKRNQKVSGNKWKWTHNNPKPMGHSKGNPESEVHSNTGLPTKDRKFSSKRPNSTYRKSRRTTNEAPRE